VQFVNVYANYLSGVFHLLGASFGALLAQKVAVAALPLGLPRAIIMIEPPPCGPSLGRIAELKLVEISSEFLVHHAPNVRMEHSLTDCDDPHIHALVLVYNMHQNNLMPFSGEKVEHTKRQLLIFRRNCRLWHHQDATPVPYPNPTIIQLARDRQFFTRAHGINFEDRVSGYASGDLLVLPPMNGQHLDVVGKVCNANAQQFCDSVHKRLQA